MKTPSITLQCPSCTSVFYSLAHPAQPNETCPHCSSVNPRESYLQILPPADSPGTSSSNPTTKNIGRFHPVQANRTPTLKPNERSRSYTSSRAKSPFSAKSRPFSSLNTAAEAAAHQEKIAPKNFDEIDPTPSDSHPLSDWTLPNFVYSPPTTQEAPKMQPATTPLRPIAEVKYLTPRFETPSPRRKKTRPTLLPLGLGMIALVIGCYWLSRKSLFPSHSHFTQHVTNSQNNTPSDDSFASTSAMEPAVEIRKAIPIQKTESELIHVSPPKTADPTFHQTTLPFADHLIPSLPATPVLSTNDTLSEAAQKPTPPPWTSVAFHQVIQNLNQGRTLEQLRPLIDQSELHLSSIEEYLQQTARTALPDDRLTPHHRPVRILTQQKDAFVFSINTVNTEVHSPALFLFHGNSVDNPQLDWRLFLQSNQKRFHQFHQDDSISLRPQWFQLLIQLTHEHQDLSQDILDTYLPLSVQESNHGEPNLILVARDTPVGRNILAQCQWSETYLVEAYVTKVSLPGVLKPVTLLLELR